MTHGTSFSKDSSILIVTDQLPYPPRNGITLPTYNYAIGLMETRKVRILLLADRNNYPSKKSLEENERIFGRIEVVPLSRKSRSERIFREIVGLEMYQHGWNISSNVEMNDDLVADVVLVSPMSAVAKWHASGLQDRARCCLSIAAVNDCTTAEYFFRGQQSFGGFKLAIQGILHRLRSYQISRVEEKLLKPYQYVLLQTVRDQHLMRELVSEDTALKVINVPNGVRAEFFTIEPSYENGSILFVAELSGEYAHIAMWLVNDLWPDVLKRQPECQLVIVGKGASAELKEAISNTVNISHIEYVEDLTQSYRKSMIVLSPIFKGYGLINKTLEAMAASIPVVGGEAAFNGIDGFQSGVHGIACKSRSTAEFSNEIVRLVSDSRLRREMGEGGRKLLEQKFTWGLAVRKIDNLIRSSNVSTSSADL